MKKSNNTRVKQIKGDASFRKFFRKSKKNFTSIIITAKKEKKKNLLIYDAINKVLIKNKIFAPKLYNEEFTNNFIEVEDLGKNTLYDILKKKNSNKSNLFKKIINVLNQIQSIKDKKIKNFKNKYYKIPTYNKKILFKETSLFCSWYVERELPKKFKIKFKKKFNKIIIKLILNLKLKNDTFVHRDFHVSNLMIKGGKIGVIDNQDALIGNRAYDLASLIDDVRLKTSNLLKDKIYKHYVQTQNKIDKNKFRNDFEILSVLRNLKIIGIFTRLAIRDKKKNYLNLIPYTWTLINRRINKNKIFDELKLLLNEYFKKKYEN